VTISALVSRSCQALSARASVSVVVAPPPAKTDVRGQTVAGFDQRDIIHEQADHPFPFAIGGVRILP